MRRPIGTVFSEAVSLMGGSEPEDSTEESGLTIPIRSAVLIAGSFYVFCGMEGNGGRGLCAVIRGCSLKSVE